jgi:hypothetical protein
LFALPCFLVSLAPALALAAQTAEDYDASAKAKLAREDFAGAVADYDQAIGRASRFCEDAELLRNIALRRLNRGDSFAELKREIARWKPEDWRTSIGLYLTGALSEKDFLRHAEANDKYSPFAGPYEGWKKGFFRGTPSSVAQQQYEGFRRGRLTVRRAPSRRCRQTWRRK